MRHLSLVCALLLGFVTGAAAQSQQGNSEWLQDRGPRFLAMNGRTKATVSVDVVRTRILQRRISVDLDGMTLRDALAEISKKADLPIMYGNAVAPLDRRVRLRTAEITVAGALTEVLMGTGVDVLLSADRRAALVKRSRDDARVGPATGAITGTVTAAETQGPVVSAQVSVEGTGLGTLTNNDGEFSITGVPAGRQAVTVTSIGYRTVTQEVEVADGATVTADFALDVSPTALADIVVTATGRQRRVEIGNAIATIRADSVVREAPVNSLTDLISGRAAGVQVMHSSGLAGSTPRIRIRGLNSAALPNDPILVVDGVRVDNSTGIEASSFDVAPGGRLNDINPEDIESIEVVKGPSAATLYGTEAANGVIVITTKRGRTGPARWSAWTEQGLSTKAIDKFRESFIAWGHTPSDPTPQRCTIPNAASGACMVDSIAGFNPLNLEETSPFTTGHRQEYGLQVSGGSERMTYLLSGELSDEDGYLRMPPAELERMEAIVGAGALSDPEFQRPNAQRQVSLRANVNAALGERFEVSVHANYVNSRSLAVIGTGGGISVVGLAAAGPGFRDENNGYLGFRFNPGEQFATKNEETVDRFVGSLSAQWQPVAWLATRGTVGLDVGSSGASSFSPTGIGVTADGRIVESSLRNLGYSVDLGATVTVPLAPRLRSKTSVGTQYNRRDQSGLSVNATGLPPGSRLPSAATGSSTTTSTTDESYVLGTYVQQQLSLNDRLFVTGAVRADGGSAFGDDVTLAAYPKASVSWVISEEPFFPRSSVLTSLRLRSAWGASGVQPRRTDVVRSYSPGVALIDGEVASAAGVTGLGNADLKPERQREVELGIEAELFDHRVSLEASYYNRASKDALVSVPVLSTTTSGFSRLQNVGSVRNRGVEGALRVAMLDTRPLAWELRVSGPYNQNRLLELAPAASFLEVGTPNFDPFRHVEGFPLFGVWEQPVSFADADGDGVITASEVEVGGTAVFWGPSHPPRELTVASTVSLFDRRVRVGTQFDYRGGHFQYDTRERLRCFSACRGLNDPSAPLAEQAAAQAAVSSAGVLPVRDASFTRFRELSVTYFVSEHLTQLVGGRPVSVTLSGRNLALWTDVPESDPEAAAPFIPGRPRDQSVNFDGFPQSRMWSVRVQVGN